MPAHALSGAEVAATDRGGGARRNVIRRNLDVIVLALALPIFLVAGLPLVGLAIAAAAWLVQRSLHAVVSRRTASAGDPRRGAVLLAAGMIGRLWLMAGAIFAAGSIEREAGLAAAVLTIALVTAYLAGAMSRQSLFFPGGRR